MAVVKAAHAHTVKLGTHRLCGMLLCVSAVPVGAAWPRRAAAVPVLRGGAGQPAALPALDGQSTRGVHAHGSLRRVVQVRCSGSPWLLASPGRLSSSCGCCWPSSSSSRSLRRKKSSFWLWVADNIALPLPTQR